jgi:PAS domain S-box-containing protein
MKQFRDLSIRQKLALVMILTSSVTVTLVGGGAIIYETVAFRKGSVHGLSVQAEVIGAVCAPALRSDDPRAAQEGLSLLKARTDVVAACLYRADGSILARYSPAVGGLVGDFPARESEGHRLERGRLLVFHQIQSEGQLLGTVYLCSNLQQYYARLRAGVTISLGTMLVSAAIAWWLAARLQRVVSDPIRELARVAERVRTCQDFSLRAGKRREDEIGTLTGEFNRMLEAIQERDAKLQRANSELQSGEQRFRQFADAVSEVLWMTDHVKGETIYVSPAYEVIWGRSCDNLYANPRSWLDAIHPQDRERVRAAATAIQTSGRLDEEYRVVRPDGSIRWVRDRGFPVRDASGTLIRLAGVAEDITERKESEAAIVRQAEIVDLAREGILVRDMAGTITLWNFGAERIYGWTKQQAVGRVSHELLQTRFLKPLSEIEEDLLRIGYWDGELVHTRRDGVQLVVESHWSLRRDEHGQPVEILEVNSDITERNRAEEAMRQLSVRLQRAQDEERRRIARELHDSTGQNLAALSMNLSVIARSAPTLDPQAQRSLAECMMLVQGCVREIRTLSYLLHPPFLDERGLESALRWFVNGFSKRSGMRVDLEVSPDWHRPAAETEIALFRVVQESLANAHRHAESLTARIRLDGNETAVRLEVEDSGKGMSEPQDANWPEGGGVGIMGMQERIKQLGGQLDIKSDNRGTTVRVTLPLGATAR